MSRPTRIRELAPGETSDAASLLARGMRDNPVHLQAYGPDATVRERALQRMFFSATERQLRSGIVLGAFRADKLVGVAGMMPPGHCLSIFAGRLTALSALALGVGLKSSRSVMEWMDDWARSDAEQRHWHVGPMAVEPRLRGQGIGSALLGECCRHIDAQRLAGYLENDQADNLSLFARFGFEVIGEHEVLGVPCWFMLREARAITGTG
jgi:GNAT superfamily N-acetyltransferase